MTKGKPWMVSAATLLSVLGIGLTLLSVGTASGAQAVSFETDKSTYIYPTDQTAQVTVRGLTECAGEEVTLGFIRTEEPADQIPSTVVSASVGANGEATASVPVLTSAFYDVWPSVRGECVPGGAIASTQPVQMLHADPTATVTPSPSASPDPTASATATPKAPATGRGTAAESGSNWLIGVTLLVVVGLGAVAARKART